ncbi:MAG: prepilin-type N-terminal cleavage/methylation domain-containing protein [Lachnospiraceae bacterium]|nr:prepilin-type N-terminal cleavage/methylation domain-containing protein [Lachnospiraceae bacterium]
MGKIFWDKCKGRNNKGFSVLEVVIAVSILSVASLIIVRLMTSSARFFENSNADVTLQSEAQLAANSIKELIVDCQHSTQFFDTKSNPADVFTDIGGTKYENALLINNEDVQYLIYPDPSDSTQLLYLSRDRSSSSGKFDMSFNVSDAEVLAEYVSNFKVDTSRYADSNIIEFSFDYDLRGRTYTGKYQVYMRNKITIDDNTDYEKSDKESVVQVIVSPSMGTIQPNTISPTVIADPQKFVAVVRTTGRKARTVKWSTMLTDATGTLDNISIDENNGVLTVVGEPEVSSFKVVATSEADTTKKGEATVQVKKVSDVSIQAISGIVGTLDGVQSAAMKSKVLLTATVNGWNLTAADKKVKWRLEYRPNYKAGGGYTLLTEYDTTTGTYKNYKPEVAQLNANGLLTLGNSATNNYEFQITATADFPNYGKPTTYTSTTTLIRVANQEISFDDKFVRGLNIDLMSYFLSGKAALDGAVDSDVTEIQAFTRVVRDAGGTERRLAADAAKLKDGVVYFDFDMFRYETSEQYKKFYDAQTVTVMFLDQDSHERSMKVSLPAVTMHKGVPGGDDIVISKGSAIDIQFAYRGINVTNENQIGIYIDDTKVAGSGASGSNAQLSAQLSKTTSAGKSAFGDADTYVDTQTVHLSASGTNKYYPTSPLTLRITMDDFYQVSDKSGDSYKEYKVYIANVEGQNVYIPVPDSTDYDSSAYSISVSGGKYYLSYSSRTYVYDATYKYWKRLSN